jgi:uncharacterized membrane protein required for colicin V production
MELNKITTGQKKAILAAASLLEGKLYNCTEIAEIVSNSVCYTTSRVVGARAEKLKMRYVGSPYGKFVEQKARYVDRPVNNWYFNELGKDLLLGEFRKNPDNTKRRKKGKTK